MAAGLTELLLLVGLALLVAGVIFVVRRSRRGKSRQGLGRQQEPEKPGLAANAEPARPAEPIEDSTAPSPQVRQEARVPAEETREVEPIFVCYRRGDSADVTGRIRDHLVTRFGQDAVFTDVDSIPLGVDFREHLKSVVASCRVLVAIVGPGWLAGGDGGRSRLDDPRDFVRIEIESALDRDVPVIPVLVGGAAMPSEREVPESISSFSYRNATKVRPDPDFRADIARLITSLEQHLSRSRE